MSTRHAFTIRPATSRDEAAVLALVPRLRAFQSSSHAEGRGIGQALLATVEQWSRDAGFRFLSLNVFADNARAVGIYEKAAYRADFVRYVKQLK